MTDEYASRAEGKQTRDVPLVTGIGQVAGDARNVLTGNHGPVTVVENQILWSFAEQRIRQGPHLLDRIDEGVLQDLFVVPRGWDEAQRELESRGTVRVTGRPNTGRRTAAWCLLARHARADSRDVQVILPDTDDNGPLFDGDEIVAGDRLLVDVSAVDEQTLARAQEELPGFLGIVLEREAVAVVVFPPDIRTLRDELRRRTHVLQRPDGFEVLQRHFTYHRLPVPDRGQAGLDTVTEKFGVGEIAHLADLAAAAYERAPDSGQEWLEKAIYAVRNRGEDARKLVTTHVKADGRALLLAAALFDGAYTETVVAAASRLLDVVAPNWERPSVFESPGLGERLKPMDATIDTDGRVRFGGLDTAASVRAHFWTHFPELRGAFRDWVRTCGPLIAREGADMSEFLQRFVDQCLRVRRREDVFLVLRRWAEGDRATTSLASGTLQYGLTNPINGWAFRRQCYKWATAGSNSGRSGVSPRLADLVVAASRDVISATHPEQAIVRLRHLAGHDDEKVAAAARAALATVVGARVDRLRYLLGRFGTRTTVRQRRADARCFVEVVDPFQLVRAGDRCTALIVSSGGRARLVDSWRNTFLDLPREQWEGRIGTWLSAATEPNSRDQILTVLASASDGRMDCVRRIETVAERWTRDQHGSTALVVLDRLRDLLDDTVIEAVLQVDDTTSSPTPPPSSGEPS